MIGLMAADIRDFTAGLFLKEIFDNFEMTEAEFVTRFTVSLDGTLLQKEEEDPGRRYIPWKKVRPLAFSIIKGKELPRSFRITLRLSDENMARTLEPLGGTPESLGIGSLLLNIHYRDKKLQIVTGCAYQNFSMDHTAEHLWDDTAVKFFRHYHIPVEKI